MRSIAKLLTAKATCQLSSNTEDDLGEDNNSYEAVLAGAALDAQALMNAKSGEAQT
jgi:hypothetical protein